MNFIQLLTEWYYFMFSFMILLIGLHMVLFFPLSLVYAFRQKRPYIPPGHPWLVSIIVPAYNEAAVIGNCVRSILNSGYDRYELILVNDGSTDNTLAEMQKFAAHGRVRIIDKENGGKASALNVGIEHARGNILFFVDADGIFRPDTISQMLRGFRHPQVGAVCGNDSPVNLDRWLPRLLAIQTHVTTGLVRRALSTMNCLPIVSGNIGAFRRDVLRQTGSFRPGFIGEDLELTWRVHRAGYQVVFQPEAVVYAEVPSTLTALWKQRVRWGRGLLQTTALHLRMFFNPRLGLMGLYLPLNVASLVLTPVLQLIVAGLLIVLILLGANPINLGFLSLLGWLGVGGTLFTTLFAIALVRGWRELKFLYLLPMWVPYAFFLNVVMLWAFVLELWGKEARWNKLNRTGVVSRQGSVLI